ncbi:MULTISPECIES: hypothetical protein [Dysgonomonas]|uniref:Dinitrogenase iron-molybdenum cofactor biosynthesis domain-containing protein n=1 Tax=Dysgonomonas gadei ATCC BAA-286 TaxID=742766 RepID=F5J269_9BACT|nr:MULTISPECIES: hypothetical protein [Dysgonomonas]EGK00325.1 hypothetical protein HMPREF9455_03464 [Dysgonomonas gadei ATCC BAA-286]MBF0650506.1 hypothetical protein [Dysgonomonas sp. GY75]
MIKTIAIITDKGTPGKEIKENMQVNVFRLENDKVSGYESIKLRSSDTGSFSKLLKIKEISLIYIDSMGNELKRLLQILGIHVKCKEEWEGDEFIRKFVFNI